MIYPVSTTRTETESFYDNVLSAATKLSLENYISFEETEKITRDLQRGRWEDICRRLSSSSIKGLFVHHTELTKLE